MLFLAKFVIFWSNHFPGENTFAVLWLQADLSQEKSYLFYNHSL